MPKQSSAIGEVITTEQDGLLNEWIDRQTAALGARRDYATGPQLREQSRRFLAAFGAAAGRGDTDIRGGG